MPNLTKEMLAVLRDEIANDPAKRGYDPKDPDATAALLNASFMAEAAPAKTLEAQPIVWRDIRRLAQARGEWPNIILRSENRPADETVRAAINARATDDDQIIDPADPEAWAPFQAGLKMFEASADLSKETVAGILALAVKDVAAVMVEQHARGMEIFASRPDVALPDDFTSYTLMPDDVKEALS